MVDGGVAIFLCYPDLLINLAFTESNFEYKKQNLVINGYGNHYIFVLPVFHSEDKRRTIFVSLAAGIFIHGVR